MSLILAMAFVVPMRASSAAAAATSATGIMIPLYIYPGSAWNTVASIQQANPGVPIVAVINPNSGPGSGSDPGYVSGIKALQAAGVTVLGYVHTSYGSRSISDVKAEVNNYHSWYSVTGIFLDEMANQPGSEAYYSSLTSYIKSLGFTFVVGNPGADTASSYVGTVDNVVIYENQGLPSASYLAGWHSNYAKSNFAMMAYGVQSVDATYPASAAPYVSYIYVTNAGLPNPYDALPPYLGAIATDLAGAAAGTSTTTTSTATTTSSPTTTSTTATATSTATVTTTRTVTATATVTTLTTVTSTVTGTATATTTTTSTATAFTTATQTATATTTTTATATKTANVTSTNSEFATTTSTGTETTTTTVTATSTATMTTTSTATATATTTTTVAAASTTSATADPPVLSTAPPVVAAPSYSSAPSMAAQSAAPSPSPLSGLYLALANGVSSFVGFLAAEAHLWAGLLGNAISEVSQGLRFAFSGL